MSSSSLALTLSRMASRLPRGGFPLVRAIGTAFGDRAQVELDTKYGRVACDLRESVCYELLKTGSYHHWADEERFAADFPVDDTTVIVDVGANIGLFAILFARQGATVHAFEPSERAGRILRRNAMLYPEIRPHQSLVADQSGELPFLEQSMTNLSSIGDGGRLMKSVALDDLDVVPDLIKIDVEGFEHLVLAGATRHLRAGVPILFEALDEKALDRNSAVIRAANEAYAIDRLGASDNYLATVPANRAAPVASAESELA